MDTVPLAAVSPARTKESVRRGVWDYLESTNLAQFPRPVHHRIPNFVGAEAAGDRLAATRTFRTARVVKVAPDKPQQQVRFRTMQEGKKLLVTTPRISSGLLNELVLPPPGSVAQMRVCATREGLAKYGVPRGLGSGLKIDLLVIGSVAVDVHGRRVGKGAGFADLGYAILRTIGAINQDTPVVTTVHDCQVYSKLPEEIFEEHDLPVDLIVTPTTTIEVQSRLPKPTGIKWHLLTSENVRKMPVLKSLRQTESRLGKDTKLLDD